MTRPTHVGYDGRTYRECAACDGDGFLRDKHARPIRAVCVKCRGDGALLLEESASQLELLR